MHAFMLVYFSQQTNEHYFTVGCEQPILPPKCTEDFTLDTEWDLAGEWMGKLKEEAKKRAAESGFTIANMS